MFTAANLVSIGLIGLALVIVFPMLWAKLPWASGGTGLASGTRAVTAVITVASNYADEAAVISAALAMKAIAAKRNAPELAALAAQATTLAMGFNASGSAK
jgi:hypothetical protein